MLIFLLPESPKSILLKKEDRHQAEQILKTLRNREDVTQELSEIENDMNQNDSDQIGIIKSLRTCKDFRMPLLTAILLNVAQQLTGINTVC